LLVEGADHLVPGIEMLVEVEVPGLEIVAGLLLMVPRIEIVVVLDRQMPGLEMRVAVQALPLQPDYEELTQLKRLPDDHQIDREHKVWQEEDQDVVKSLLDG